jgi:hypothetical protein
MHSKSWLNNFQVGRVRHRCNAMRQPNYKKPFLFILAGELMVMGLIGTLILPDLIDEQQVPLMLAIAALFLLLSLGVPFLFLRPRLRQHSIAEKGQPAAATLLEFWDTGVTINDHPQVKMRVEVHPRAGSSYEAELVTIVPRLLADLLVPGARLVVSCHPERPEELAFLSMDSPSAEMDESGPPSALVLEEISRQARLAELEELHTRHMIGDSDYRRRRDELLALQVSG